MAGWTDEWTPTPAVESDQGSKITFRNDVASPEGTFLRVFQRATNAGVAGWRLAEEACRGKVRVRLLERQGRPRWAGVAPWETPLRAAFWLPRCALGYF